MPATAPPRLVILAYPGAQTAAIHGLLDLFAVAGHLRQTTGGQGPGLEVQVWPEAPGQALAAGPVTALILPPSIGYRVAPEQLPGLVTWIRAQHGQGALVCSVCAGAFLLAETGLLSGRPATTHWALTEPFKQRFPLVQLDTGRLIVDDGDLITAGGLMAWVDLGLRLIQRFLGPAIMVSTAQYFLVDPGGREQRTYQVFAPVLNHGDGAVLRAQHWLQRHSGEPVSVTHLAEIAGLGERTLLRRFQRATGHTPLEYLQQLRVAKAQDLLAQSGLSLEEVAWRVGYQDPGAFRKVFQRILGIGPGPYRRRFTLPAPARDLQTQPK